MTSNPITLSKRSQFWIFQALGWSVWVALLSFADLFVYPEFLIPRILCWVLVALIGMMLTNGLRALAVPVKGRSSAMASALLSFAMARPGRCSPSRLARFGQPPCRRQPVPPWTRWHCQQRACSLRLGGQPDDLWQSQRPGRTARARSGRQGQFAGGASRPQACWPRRLARFSCCCARP